MQADKLRELRNLVVGGVYALTPDQQRAIDELLAIAEAAEDLRALLREARGWIGNTAGTASQTSAIIARIDAALSTVVPVREGE